MLLEILVAKLATNFQDLVAKVKNLVALAPVLGAILCPDAIFNLVLNWSRAVVFGTRATTAQLNTFEFDQGHVTKNQPITMLVLLSESLGI